ncbi:hypothetical protein BKK56_10635 [Rodentibacter genomosp. 2]|uniref:O-antigen ligase family protein n=1 Tax=Rodentibacter genomosp. 2 TaxID=1908266 RepID=UPI00098583D5|nr:hypothetical protein BKK56_10635 [Rodentibacter genomosp. 2]
MPLNKLAVNIYLLSIFSLFLPFTAYAPLFLLFIGVIFIDTLIRKEIKSKYIKNIFWFFLFIGIAVISHIINIEHSDKTQLIKLIINFLFMIAFIIFQANHADYLRKMLASKLPFLIEVILLITFLQVAVNLAKMNLWIMPFTGIQNSMDAYLIVEPDMYFGSKEKNIWATKIVLISIIYISFYLRGIYQLGKLRAYFSGFLILFNTLYTFSRTAQLMLIISAFLYMFWKIFYIYRNAILKIFASTFLFILTSMASIIIVDKLLHITLSSGDGLAARFELWNALYQYYLSGKMNLVMGNGILSGEYIISHYTNWDNNNFHNVFLNTFSDLGLIGLVIYLLLLKNTFITGEDKIDRRFSFLVLFTPFFVCINSQYLGYDSDIAIYLTLVIVLMDFLSVKNSKNYTHI